MSEHKIVVDDFNPKPSEDYATLRRQFSALITVIRGNNAQFASYDSKFRELRHEASLSNKQEIDSLRKTNEYLTNMIDRDLQSENERLRAQVEALLAVNQVMRDALQMLYDNQNGAPLPQYETDWKMAMDLTRKSLSLKPSDVELVEVNHNKDFYVDHFGEFEWHRLPYDTKMYVLKQKEGK